MGQLLGVGGLDTPLPSVQPVCELCLFILNSWHRQLHRCLQHADDRNIELKNLTTRSDTGSSLEPCLLQLCLVSP